MYVAPLPYVKYENSRFPIVEDVGKIMAPFSIMKRPLLLCGVWLALVWGVPLIL
jgi:hypothetical protein